MDGVQPPRPQQEPASESAARPPASREWRDERQGQLCGRVHVRTEAGALGGGVEEAAPRGLLLDRVRLLCDRSLLERATVLVLFACILRPFPRPSRPRQLADPTYRCLATPLLPSQLHLDAPAAGRAARRDGGGGTSRGAGLRPPRGRGGHRGRGGARRAAQGRRGLDPDVHRALRGDGGAHALSQARRPRGRLLRLQLLAP